MFLTKVTLQGFVLLHLFLEIHTRSRGDTCKRAKMSSDKLNFFVSIIIHVILGDPSKKQKLQTWAQHPLTPPPPFFQNLGPLNKGGGHNWDIFYCFL